MPKLEETVEYFRKKAKKYDLVETQMYWNLSDDLLWYLMKKLILDNFKERKIKFMDAGGGTGRWAIKILEHVPDSEGTICDVTEEMLSEAAKKSRNRGLSKRLNMLKCNIENMYNQPDETYDIVINLHNVLAFTENPEKALSEMYRILKKNGILLSVVPNRYHAIYFNISIGRFDDIEKLAKDYIGRFTDNMPYVNMFTPDRITSMYKKLGLKDIKVLGFPVCIYPSVEETKISGNSISAEHTLGNKKIYEIVLALEKQLIMEENAAARGNNLFAIGVK
jgi:ubiquinone/menaquinone biosynthesis C-methylase UbiE